MDSVKKEFTEEMRYHLRGLAEHTISLFRILLPDEDTGTIAALTTSVVANIFSKLDPSYDWTVSITPK